MRPRHRCNVINYDDVDLAAEVQEEGEKKAQYRGGCQYNNDDVSLRIGIGNGYKEYVLPTALDPEDILGPVVF